MDRQHLQEKLSQPFDSSVWKEVVEGVLHHVQYFAKERPLYLPMMKTWIPLWRRE